MNLGINAGGSPAAPCTCLLRTLFFPIVLSVVAIAQDSADPTRLLGISYDQVRHLYTDDCKALRPARYADETKNGSLQLCEIKHHSQELVPGSKISKELMFFKNQSLIEVDFVLKGRTAASGLAQLYGQPDPAVQMPTNYAFGQATFGDEGSSTTLDSEGESHFYSTFWTRPHFQIWWQYTAYMSWNDMVERDTSILGGLLNKPQTHEKVSFILRPDQPDIGTSTSSEAVKQLITNSEAAKSSPAQAAVLANVGHVPSPEELAHLVQTGQASRCAVVTSPPGATIYVDGNKAGISPIAFVLLRMSGTPRVITIKLDGYKTVEQTFVPDGKTIPIGLTLEKVPTDK